MQIVEDSDCDSFRSVPEGAWWTAEDLEELCRKTAERTAEQLVQGIESSRFEINELTLQYKCQMAENVAKLKAWRLP